MDDERDACQACHREESSGSRVEIESIRKKLVRAADTGYSK
jgi:hypothetical protein